MQSQLHMINELDHALQEAMFTIAKLRSNLDESTDIIQQYEALFQKLLQGATVELTL